MGLLVIPYSGFTGIVTPDVYPSADRKTVFLSETDDDNAAHFIEQVHGLNVNHSSGGPELHNPAVLESVIEAIG